MYFNIYTLHLYIYIEIEDISYIYETKPIMELIQVILHSVYNQCLLTIFTIWKSLHHTIDLPSELFKILYLVRISFFVYSCSWIRYASCNRISDIIIDNLITKCMYGYVLYETEKKKSFIKKKNYLYKHGKGYYYYFIPICIL